MRQGSWHWLRGRWAEVALAASLVLNAFLIGLLVTGSGAATRAVQPDEPRALYFELRRLSDGLSQDSQAHVRDRLGAVRPQVEERVERLRRIRAEILALAAAPQPDRAALDDQLAALREEVHALQVEVQAATYDALLELPPEARRGLTAER
jgi:uncharacterized membrane protein